ncbi:MAG: hypothetical protein ABI867_19750 [Kofleriaceae bacterium]
MFRTLALVCLAACSLRDPPTTTPAAPLPADPPLSLESMDIECDAMIAALARYKACTNLEPEDVDGIDAWIETANRNFAAGKKASPEANAQTAIAGACHRATASVKAAHERCLAGPRPKL